MKTRLARISTTFLTLFVVSFPAPRALPAGEPAPPSARVVLVAGGGNNTNQIKPLPATEVRLESPFGVDFDGAGNLYLVEMTAHRLRKLEKNGRLAMLAGTGAKGSAGDGGPARQAQLNGPHNLAVSRN